MLAVGLLASAIGGAYAGLIPSGRWQVDEYRLFTMLRELGLDVMPGRLLFSPRPFSELLILLYGEAVLHLDRPLVTLFLAVVWTSLVASTGLAAFAALPRSSWRPSLALAFALALIATVLTGTNVTEAFYWPIAAAAYIPTLAAALCLFFMAGSPMNRRRRIASGLALTVAACSSEVGAAFALCFALTMAAEKLLRVLRQTGPVPTRTSSAWWLIPGVIGLLVLLIIFYIRHNVTGPGATNAHYTGRYVASVLAAVRELPIELIVGGDSRSGWPVVASICASILFTVGFAASWRLVAPDAARLDAERVALWLALLGAAFFSIAAAYQHYGQLCCERQQSVRQGFLTLSLVVLIAPALARLPLANMLAHRVPTIPVMMLIAGLMLPLFWRYEGLSGNYAFYYWSVEARTRTWASGLQSDTAGMIFYLPPDGPALAVKGTGLPLQTYTDGPDEPALARDVAHFFGKRRVTVCQPWQIERSLIVGGRVIPACVMPPDP